MRSAGWFTNSVFCSASLLRPAIADHSLCSFSARFVAALRDFRTDAVCDPVSFTAKSFEPLGFAVIMLSDGVHVGPVECFSVSWMVWYMAFAKSRANLNESLCGIQVVNRQRQFAVSRPSVALFCLNVLRSFYADARALSVVFIGARRMRAINGKYLGHDYATDVLSFSYKGSVVEGRPFLGEIVIAPEVAAAHAARYGTSPEREIRKLLVHGILHLLGYNHETDRGQMNRLQKKLLRRKLLANAPLCRQ